MISYLFDLFVWFILSTFLRSKSKRDEWKKYKPRYPKGNRWVIFA